MKRQFFPFKDAFQIKATILAMRIPIFEEIIVKKFDLISLTKFFAQKKFGNCPHFINLNGLSAGLVNDAIDNIANALDRLSIHPKFPYPLYIITEAINTHPVLQVSATTNELPAHYIRKVKRLKNKELAILNKTLLLSEKLSNQEIDKKLNDLSSAYGPQRSLYNNCREIHFYQFILDKLNTRN